MTIAAAITRAPNTIAPPASRSFGRSIESALICALHARKLPAG